jgi:hypothetical protein
VADLSLQEFIRAHAKITSCFSANPDPSKKEPDSKRSILFKVKEGENFNRRRHEVSALVNIVNISRIEI